MKEFTMHEVTLEHEYELESVDGVPNKVMLSVTRTRTSKGFGGIKLMVGNTRIEFHSEESGFGPHYEQVALKVASMLDEICMNPCNIPTGDKS